MQLLIPLCNDGMQRPWINIQQMNVCLVLTNCNDGICITAERPGIITLKRCIRYWLRKTSSRQVDLDIASARNKWAVKTRPMSDVPALIELNDGDAIDRCSLLRVSKTICEKREDNNTAEYDAPVPVTVF